MKPVPHATLERLAHEEYRRKYAEAPEPVIQNVEPLIALHAPRLFTFGGIGYRAPPTPYLLGVRLMRAANRLREIRRAHPKLRVDLERRATSAVATLVRLAVRPAGPFRLLAPFLPCPFATGKIAELEEVIRWIIEAPDESAPPPPPREVERIDVIDGLFAFARVYPSLIGRDGYPISYRVYLYGMRHIGRQSSREDLRQGTAMRWAHAGTEGWKQYEADQRAAAGW